MGLTILLVDDDQILTEKTKNSLNWDSLGIGMVFTANNIHEAKGILKVYKVDILLCDVDMPMGSGLELVEWIREEGKDMKCIFLSSYANFTYAQKALRLGSVNYLLKPISNKDLEAELKTVCDELLKEHTNLNSQEKKQREEVWKRCWCRHFLMVLVRQTPVVYQMLNIVNSIHLCSQLHLFLQGFSTTAMSVRR